MQRIGWERVKDIYVENGSLHVQLKSGSKLSLRLVQGDSQTVRSRIDQLFREALVFQNQEQANALSGATP